MPVTPQKTNWTPLVNGIAIVLSVLGVVGYVVLIQYPYHITYVQLAHIEKITLVTLACLVGGFFCAVSSFCSCNSKRTKIISLGCISLSLIGGLAFLVALPSTGVKSIYTAQDMCINRAREIEAAKGAWAEQHGATNGATVTWNDIASYFTNDFPKCPEGGTYTLGKVGEPVLCSIPEHRLP
jgi:hypothetical protein